MTANIVIFKRVEDNSVPWTAGPLLLELRRYLPRYKGA